MQELDKFTPHGGFCAQRFYLNLMVKAEFSPEVDYTNSIENMAISDPECCQIAKISIPSCKFPIIANNHGRRYQNPLVTHW